MGRYRVMIRLKVQTIKYWCRLTRLEDIKVVRQVYSLLRYLTDLGFDTWTSYVKQILCDNNADVYERNYVTKSEEISMLDNL